MTDIRGIETLLDSASDLLAQAENKDMGPLWRGEVENWRAEQESWLEGFKRHQADAKSLGSHAQWHGEHDADIDKRFSKVEGALTNLALSVLTLQNLLLGSASNLTPWQMAQQAEPDREVELVDGTKIKVKDVPIDPATGMPEESWAMEHCPCETHEAKRKAAAVGTDSKTGQYL